MIGLAEIAALVKEKLKKSDDQTNIDKYRVIVHKILQNIMSEQNFEIFVEEIILNKDMLKFLNLNIEILCFFCT